MLYKSTQVIQVYIHLITTSYLPFVVHTYVIQVYILPNYPYLSPLLDTYVHTPYTYSLITTSYLPSAVHTYVIQVYIHPNLTTLH